MSDEYIKREDAIKIINSGISIDTDADKRYVNGLFRAIRPADVAPVRHGRWVESFKDNAPPTLRSRWTCSWCGNVQTYGATDYCPNCGARMDAKE